MKNKIIIFIIGLIILNPFSYAFIFPKTNVSILNYQNGSSFEVSNRMVPIEVQSSQQLKFVKLQINDKKPTTICRDDCWDFKTKKPIPRGINNITIILENFENEKQKYNFSILVKK